MLSPTHRVCLALTAAYCALPASIAQAQRPTGYEDYQVVDIQIQNQAELEVLRRLEIVGRDFQVWSEVAAIGRPTQVRVAPAARPALDASGLHYEVVIKDLQQYLDSRFDDTRGAGFFDALRTYDEHVQFLTDLATAYPDLTEMISLGDSVQGRPLWALHITGPEGVKPGVIYHGGEHGNEQAPASVVAYVANHLLTNYATDPQVAWLVDHVDWYLLPIMNPDGYVSYDRMNAHGVDLNRNWAGPGAGQDPWGGAFPFSEPETGALRDFFLSHPTVRVHLDLHGYVPWIIWPWAHIPDHCADHAQFEAVGIELRDRIAASGGGTYTIGTIYSVVPYPTSGTSANYSYGVLDLWAFGMEVVHADMPDICQEFLTAMLYLGQWIRETDCNGNGVDDVDDIAAGTSPDDDGNGIPDECEVFTLSMPLPEDSLATTCTGDADCGSPGAVCVASKCYVPKNRYISIDPNPSNTGVSTARRVSLYDLGGQNSVLGWVGEPIERTIAGPETTPQLLARIADTPHYRDWSVNNSGQPWVEPTVQIGDCETSPGHTYLVQAIVEGTDIADEANYSASLMLRTATDFGDVVGASTGTPPDGTRTFKDITAVVRGFQSTQSEPKVWLDLQGGADTPQVPDFSDINFADISHAVSGFQGGAYPFAAPGDCP